MHLRACLPFLLAFAVAACGPTGEPLPIWEPAFDVAGVGWLLDAWGPDADTLYVVGGIPGSGTLLRSEGGAFVPVDPGFAVPLLNWAWGSAADDVFVVGEEGTVLHYDGAGWEQQATPTSEALWGVWGSAPDDVWAVGGSGQSASSPVILHYDGVAWSAASYPTLVRANVHAFFKVWGAAPNDVYVVGQRGVVLHHDGVELTELFVGVSEDLVAVHGTDGDHVVAVGGRGNGVIARWDGLQWTSAALAPTPGLNGVYMRNPAVVHVAGEEGTYARVDFESLALETLPIEANLDVHALFADPGGVLMAVGGNFASPAGPYEGLALRRRLDDAE